ncbi:MAG: sigma 54-interacting transcriptional regulator [Pseudomonadota bacterium]
MTPNRPENNQSAVSQRMVDLILDNVGDGVFTVDKKFRITFFSRSAEVITGFTSQEALGKPCYEIFRTSMCSHDCPLNRSLKTGQRVANVEIDILTKDGKQQTVSVSTAPLVAKGGQFMGGVETFRDLSLVKDLRRELKNKYTFQDIISKNVQMRQLFETLPNIAKSNATVLIQGRSGSGKELFAKAIHNTSPRKEGPLVKVNCGALPEHLLQAELFGQDPGNGSGMQSSTVGGFQAAQGGTIFLEDLGEIPLFVQVKLLQVLEQREIRTSPSMRPIPVDVRVITGTKQDMQNLVAQGRFLEDLFYRLNVVLVRIPDLKDRREDIPLLVEHFIERFNNRMGRFVQSMSKKALAILMSYPFPGNVRELENVIEHAHIVAKGRVIGPHDLPQNILNFACFDDGTSMPNTRYGSFSTAEGLEAERERLSECLKDNFWSIPRAARELGLHRTTLWRKVKRLNISRP